VEALVGYQQRRIGWGSQKKKEQETRKKKKQERVV
jgi:hypothetical protein